MFCAWQVCVPAHAQEKPSLQTLFKESTPQSRAITRATGDVIEIDLAEWQNEYDETLNIATGKKYKFTNGELNWIGGDAPLITVSGNSEVEFAEGTKIYSRISAYSPLILLNGHATVKVDGGHLKASTKPIPVGTLYGVYTYMDAIKIDPETEFNKIIEYSGEILGSITCESTNSYNTITLEGGSVGGVKCETDIFISGELSIYNPDHYHTMYKGLDLGKNGVAYLMSGYKKPSGFFLGSSSVCSQFSIDFDNCKGRTIVKSGVNHQNEYYSISEADLAEMSVNDLDTEKYELVLEDIGNGRNRVFIRDKSITGQEWLQEQINSYVDIKTDTDVQPGIITIPEEGIELTDLLTVPKGAFVKLVGGPITLSKDFNPDPDFAVRVYEDAHLFIDNTWDFNALPLKTFAWVFANNGHLSFGENSTLLNTWTEASRTGAFIHNNGRFDFNNPNSQAYRSEVRINGSFVDGKGIVEIRNGFIYAQKSTITAGNCYVYGGTIESHEVAIDAVEFDMFGGFIASSFEPCINVKCAELKDGSFHYTTSYVSMITSSGDIRDHTIVFKDISNDYYNCLLLTSKLTHNQHVKFDWDKIDFSSPKIVVRGHNYQLTQQDCDNFVFDKLPSNIRAKLDGNTIILTKEKKNLHDLFDDDDVGKGTESNPADIMGEEDDVDAEEPEDVKPDLHVIFGDPEDRNEGDDAKKSLTFLFDGEYGMKIPSSSSVEFKNLNIDLGEHALNSVVEVYGKLVINVNVYIRKVCTCTKQVIYVRPGGTVIWRGGINSIPGVVIYNDGGTVIYEGGDTYGSIYGIHNINGGKIIVKGGSIGGGEYAIYNPSNGETHLYDKVIINGDIYTNDNITTGGNVGITTLYIPWNCHINLTSSISTNWFINISDIQNVIVPTAFIYGTDGYKLTEEDLKHIKTNLPESYCLILDINMNIIYIVDCKSLGIEDNIINANKVIDKIYSIDGKPSENRSGMKLVRYSDGTIHKVIRK